MKDLMCVQGIRCCMSLFIYCCIERCVQIFERLFVHASFKLYLNATRAHFVLECKTSRPWYMLQSHLCVPTHNPRTQPGSGILGRLLE